VDEIDVRPFELLEQLASLGREALHVFAIALRIERVEGQGGFARTGDAGDDHQSAPRMRTSRFLRLCSRAPLMWMNSPGPDAMRRTQRESPAGATSECERADYPPLGLERILPKPATVLVGGAAFTPAMLLRVEVPGVKPAPPSGRIPERINPGRAKRGPVFGLVFAPALAFLCGPFGFYPP